ncbi:MAG: hypothetical protein IPK82_38815 [Polyangiaceae bacterium]|nr:hypothetical protein [Polyangiaceae bacterium]
MSTQSTWLTLKFVYTSNALSVPGPPSPVAAWESEKRGDSGSLHGVRW